MNNRHHIHELNIVRHSFHVVPQQKQFLKSDGWVALRKLPGKAFIIHSEAGEFESNINQ